MFLLSRFNLCKTPVKGSYVSIIAGFYFTTFAKVNTVTGIFQRFYLDLEQFSIACNISEVLPVADSVSFKFSVTKQSFSCSDLA